MREVVFIDPSETSATSMSVNLNLAQYMCVGFNLLQPIQFMLTPPLFSSCLEHITYTPRPDNTTLFRQRAMLVSGFPTKIIARRIEQASYDRFKSNAGIGKQGFDWVLAGN